MPRPETPNFMTYQDIVATIPFSCITTTDALTEAIAYLQKQPEIALDLEFDSHHYSYGFTLCLVQLSDGKKCFLIDPLKLQDLKPLFTLLEDPAVTKIIHQASSDLLLLSKMGCQTKNIFDTAIAARILNYPKASLAAVMQKELGITLDKSQQSSNWTERPLTEAQLTYAAMDVWFLPQVKAKLWQAIQELGREKWMEEEGELREQITYSDPEEPHLLLRFENKLSYFQEYILKPIFMFREKVAEELDVPPGKIISRRALLPLLKNPAGDLHEWLNHTRGIHDALRTPEYEKELGEIVHQAVQEAIIQNIPNTYPPNPYMQSLRSREAAERKDKLVKIQKRLKEKYGKFASMLLLDKCGIIAYSESGKLTGLKKYAEEIIRQTAAEMEIQLEK